MVWLVLAVLVVGYFIIRALNGSSGSTLLPIGRRIALLQEHTAKLESYVGGEYKKDMDEYKKLRHHKHAKYEWKTWHEDVEKMHSRAYDNFVKMVTINSRLCQRYSQDEQKLFDQLVDWGTYLDQMRDNIVDSIGTDDYINAGLDVPRDEVASAKRAGIAQETYKRILDRAKTEKILTKDLTPVWD